MLQVNELNSPSKDIWSVVRPITLHIVVFTMQNGSGAKIVGDEMLPPHYIRLQQLEWYWQYFWTA